MIVLNEPAELDLLLRENQLVLVQFGAESCAPCSAIRRKITDWNEDHAKIPYLYIPTEQFPELCAQLGVFTVPTIFVYAEGSLTVRESGYFGLEGVLRKIERYEEMILK